MTLNCISWERSSITASCDANVISADVTPRCGLLLQMGEQKEVDGVGMLFITLKADSNEKMSPVYSENATNRLYTVQAEPAGWKQAVTRDGEHSFKKKKKKAVMAQNMSVSLQKNKKQNKTKPKTWSIQKWNVTALSQVSPTPGWMVRTRPRWLGPPSCWWREPEIKEAPVTIRLCPCYYYRHAAGSQSSDICVWLKAPSLTCPLLHSSGIYFCRSGSKLSRYLRFPVRPRCPNFGSGWRLNIDSQLFCGHIGGLGGELLRIEDACWRFIVGSK